MEQRLHKILALAGISSRRKAEELIKEGLIQVNGKIIRGLGVKVNPDTDKIYYAGRLIKPEKKVYFLLNKPKGYLCTNYDPQGRRLVTDLFRNLPYRLYTVGRLDAESEGLVILTNDGELCNKLTHPRYEVPKTYQIVVDSYLTPEVLEKVQKGVWLSEGKTAPTRIRIIKRARNFTLLGITLKEGKKREIRRIFAKFGYKVKSLVRSKIGKLTLDNLKPGQSRQINQEVIENLVININK
jgi:pseudouridine synthase